MSHPLFLYQNPYLTKYWVGVGWAVTKYQVGIALLSQGVALFFKPGRLVWLSKTKRNKELRQHWSQYCLYNWYLVLITNDSKSFLMNDDDEMEMETLEVLVTSVFKKRMWQKFDRAVLNSNSKYSSTSNAI